MLQIFSAVDYTLEISDVILVEVVGQEAEGSQIEGNQLQRSHDPKTQMARGDLQFTIEQAQGIKFMLQVQLRATHANIGVI